MDTKLFDIFIDVAKTGSFAQTARTLDVDPSSIYVLSLTTRVTKSKGVRIFHEYELKKGDDLIATGTSVIASVNSEGKVSRLPDWLIMK